MCVILRMWVSYLPLLMQSVDQLRYGIHYALDLTA